MSNSAFTPTQIEVTNEVPVNVPVVTADKLFVPSIGISGTFSSQKGEYQRAGARMNGRVQLTFATVSAINSPYTLTIPDSLNYDGTNIPVSDEPIVGTFSLWDASASYIEYVGTVHVNSATTLKFKAHGQTAFNNSSVPVTLAANDILEIQFSLPIAEWAGSGTTTLATRAVEEYAYNTSTTDADDTTSFGYGPAGVNFGSFTAARSKRVRFQTAIQSTDRLSLEFKRDGQWIPIEACTTQGAAPFFIQGANTYGMTLEQIAGNNTDVTVKFGIYRNTANATYGGAGNAWSFLAGGTAQWRVRKVSSGAQVGYPVSARNIVGDTSGTTVPTGMLGEQLSQSRLAASALALTTNTATNVTATALTLTPGTWDLSGFIGINGSATSVIQIFAGISTTSATLSSQDNSTIVDAASRNLSTSDYQASLPTYRVTISSNTTYYLVVRAIFSGGGNTANVFGRIQATRIA